MWSASRQSRGCFLLQSHQGLFVWTKMIALPLLHGERCNEERNSFLIVVGWFFLTYFRKTNGGNIYSSEYHPHELLVSVICVSFEVRDHNASDLQHFKFFSRSLRAELFLSNEAKQRETPHFSPKSPDLWYSHNKGQICIV